MSLRIELINIIVETHGTNLKTHQALWHKTCLAVPEFGNFMSELKGKNDEERKAFIKLWNGVFALQLGKYTAAGCRIIESYRNLFGETLSEEFKSFIEPLLASASQGKNILYFKFCLLLSLILLFTVGSAQPLPTPAELVETETNAQSGMDDQLIVEQV